MASLISWLKYAGARKSDGTPVASGFAWFYQPGTTNVQVPVYGDRDALYAIGQPVALDAGGRAEVYARAPLQVLVQDAFGATVALEDRANTVAAAQVEVQQAGISGVDPATGVTMDGGRTDLETVLSTVGASFGTGFLYKESNLATPRNVNAAVGAWVSPQDYGALGNDSNDDTNGLQAAINRCIATGKGLWLPPGIYRITQPLTVSGAAAAGLHIAGAARAFSVIKNMSTTGHALVIDMSSAVESHMYFENFAITASTVSSGSALRFVNGDGPSLARLWITAHRTAFDLAAINFADLEDCLVSSTDGNAAGVGYGLGVSATAVRCRTVQTNGKGFSLAGAFARVLSCRSIVTTGVGFDISASDATATLCLGAGCTTTFNVGAVARAGAILCAGGDGGTSDFATSASATAVIDDGNTFATRTPLEVAGTVWAGPRGRATTRNRTLNTAGMPQTWTPDPTKGELQVWVNTNTAGGTLTIAATATAGLVDGQRMLVVLENQQDTNALTLTWTGSAGGYGGTAGLGGTLGKPSTGNNRVLIEFIWRTASTLWVAGPGRAEQGPAGTYIW